MRDFGGRFAHRRFLTLSSTIFDTSFRRRASPRPCDARGCCTGLSDGLARVGLSASPGSRLSEWEVVQRLLLHVVQVDEEVMVVDLNSDFMVGRTDGCRASRASGARAPEQSRPFARPRPAASIGQ